MLSNEMIEKLKALAATEAACDDEDFNPYDVSGGNFDDAYYAGSSDGEILLARMIVADLVAEKLK